jgi:U4/U6 small nuclear ribonucleoprotein PRP31
MDEDSANDSSPESDQEVSNKEEYYNSSNTKPQYSDLPELNPATDEFMGDINWASINEEAQTDLRSLARVFFSKSFRRLLVKVKSKTLSISSEAANEYSTIVAANSILPEIDAELAVIHKYVAEVWGPRFPELISLVRAPLAYLRAVHALDTAPTNPDSQTNSNRNARSTESLRDLLPEPVVLSVTLALSTNRTSGNGGGLRPITELDSAKARIACTIAFTLESARSTMLQYIESRMTIISPNLSALIGTAVAARLMGAAGGLDALCRIPSCNMLILGKSDRMNASGLQVSDSAQGKAGTDMGAFTGLSNLGGARHRGHVWDAELVRMTPSEYRRKAARLVANKVCLCARMDLSASYQYKDGNYVFYAH